MQNLFHFTAKRRRTLYKFVNIFSSLLLVCQSFTPYAAALLSSPRVAVAEEAAAPSPDPEPVEGESTPAPENPEQQPEGEPEDEPESSPTPEEPAPTENPEELATIEDPIVEPTVDPIAEPTVEPTIDPTITPVLDLDNPAEPPESADLANDPDSTDSADSSETAEVTPADSAPVEQACVEDGQEIVASAIEDWDLDIYEHWAQTSQPVELGVRYVYPQDDKVTVSFTCLPKDESLRTPLKIQKIAVSELNLPEGINPATEFAYDITTSMADGTFKYDLTLPKSTDHDAEVSYIEKSSEEVINQTDSLEVEDIKEIENNVSQENDIIKASGVDHFSIYLVTANETVGNGGVTNPDDGWISDNIYALFDNDNDYAEYGFPEMVSPSAIPSNAIINGIEVFIEGYRSSSRDFEVSLWNVSNNNPDAYTSRKTSTLSNTDAVYTLGSSVDLWGETWLPSDFSDAVFKVRVDADNDSGNAYLDSLQVKVHYTAPVVNPPLSQACGLDIALVIDNSTSIDSSEMTQIKNAMTAFTGALNGTPTWFSVTRFATTASVVQTFTSDISAVNAAINSIPVGGGFTNWQDGLVKTQSTFDFDRDDKPDLVIFASDGNPNRTGPSGTSVPEAQAVADAVVVADALKTANIRILAIGVGADLDTANMIAISGPNVNTGDVLTSDVITTDFSGLAAQLAAFASQTCGGTISVNKYYDQVDPNSRGGAGWIFDIAGTIKTTDVNGQTDAVDVPAGDNYSVTETNMLPGYSYGSASCKNQAGAPIGTPDNDNQRITGISISDSDIISCDFVNNTIPATGNIIIDKVTDPAGDPQSFTFSPSYGVNFNLTDADTPHDSGALTAGTYTVTESVPSGWDPTSIVCNDPDQGSSGDIPTATATIDLDAGETISCTFTNSKLSIDVTKTANPTSVPETGGDVEYTVKVDNPSAVSVNLTSLVDDKFGNLDGMGTCDVPVTIASLGYYECKFTETLTGNAGQTHTNTITATASGVSDNDDATVTFEDVAPKIEITKTADDTSIPETGQDVTFTFEVKNTGDEDVTLTSLTDTVFGDLNGQGDCAVPQTILIGNSYTCKITQNLKADDLKDHYNVATAQAEDDDKTTATDDDDETVKFEDVLPNIEVTKAAGVLVLPVPGGDVEFAVVITNNSLEPVTLTSLKDNIYGDLNGKGTCVTGGSITAGGGTYTCKFTGTVNGNPGFYTDIVEAVATDNDGSYDTKTDDATVELEGGKIITEKQTLPDGSTQSFEFDPSWSESDFYLTDGQQNDSGWLAPGNYSVAEAGNNDWQKTDVTCSSSIDDQESADALELEAGETITCVFTNSKIPTLTVTKLTVPSDDPGLFNLLIDGNQIGTDVGNNYTTNPLRVDIGYNHAVTETAGTGTDLNNYAAVFGGDCDSSGHIILAAGEDENCTITNTRKTVPLYVGKYEDDNFNGAKDDGEDPLDGWTMELYTNDACSGDPIATAVTNSDAFPGTAKFDSLYQGQTYWVKEVEQSGWQNTTGNCRNFTMHDDSNSNNLIEFGNFRFGRVNGHKYRDVDMDGTYDEGEDLLSGWVINLYKQRPNGSWPVDPDKTRTTDGGRYEFGGMTLGNYKVCEVLKPGWHQTEPGNTIHLNGVTPVDPGCHYFSIVQSGQEYLGRNGLQFGNIEDGKIYGLKWEDMDGDRDREDGDNGIENWEINLCKASDPTIRAEAILGDEVVRPRVCTSDPISTLTDADGNYTFGNLPLGTYAVWEQNRVGWTHTTPNHYLVTLTGDGYQVEHSFGNFKNGRVRGVKCEDPNGDGDFLPGHYDDDAVGDSEEPDCVRLEGWTIELYDNLEGSPIATDSTDVNGKYEFTGLLPNVRYFIKEVLQPGWLQTRPSDLNFGRDYHQVMSRESGRTYFRNFGNQRAVPSLVLSKSDNKDGVALFSGDTITFSIEVRNDGKGMAQGVVINDTMPYSDYFDYLEGTAMLTCDGGATSTAVTPVTVNPYAWSIGDMDAGDVCKLTYDYKILNDSIAGAHTNWAYANGTGLDGKTYTTEIIPDPFDVGYARNLSAGVTSTVLGAATGAVLGAATGSSTLTLIIAIVMVMAGAFLLLKRRNMKKLIMLMLMSGLVYLTTMVGSVQAVEEPTIKVAIVDLPEYLNKRGFEISYTAIDAGGTGLKDVKIEYMKDGDSWKEVGTYTEASRKVNLDSGQINEDKKFFFRATAWDNAGNQSAVSETSTMIDTQGPPQPENFSKEHPTQQSYKIKWHNADSDDLYEVYIYRADHKDFTADKGNEVARIGVSKNTDNTWEDAVVPDSSKTYYYVMRSVDRAGNGSNLVGDMNIVEVAPTGTAVSGTSGEGVAGQVPVAGEGTGGSSGQILGEETAEGTEAATVGEELTLPSETEEGMTGTAATTKKPWLLIGLGALALAGGAFWFFRKEK